MSDHGPERANLPTYTAAGQGIDQDRDIRSPVTERHLTWQRKLRQTRHAVVDELRGQQQDKHAALDAVDRQPPRASRSKTPQLNDTDEAFIYARVSTREQARSGGREEGFSIPYQRQACRTKADTLGAVVVGEYVDAGESAKTTHRPQLQQLLKDIKKRRVRYLIVHKIDRLARNREDDMAIRLALARAGVELISCTENITNTAHGRFLHNIMTDMAEFYRDNLADEVMKGLVGKVQAGGTPFRAPLGYLNKRELRDGVSVSWIEPDEVRAPVIRWCFEQYATGDWSGVELALAAQARGLTTRPTRKKPAEPISLNTLYNILRNPYYMGIIAYNGAHYPGTHPPLIDAETWLRVQDILAAHHHAGEKDRRHPHYLRGTIFCSGCGARLVYSRNRGNGGEYEYYLCLKKKLKANTCTRGAVRLEKIEDGIARFYVGFQPSQERLRGLREAVVAELRAQSTDAEQNAQAARKRHKDLLDERAKLMQAHYADAVPLDLLKSEMERLTRAIAEAETQMKAATRGLEKIEQTLVQAMIIAEGCHRLYETATPAIRRQINQGFFTKLYIGPDGSVERYDLTEPFRQLLGVDLAAPMINSFDLETRTAPDDLVRRGVKESYVVGDTGIEPVTSSVSGKRSPAELIARALA